MSGRHERALAKLLAEQMDKRDAKDTSGRIRLAEVVTVDPMSIRPMGGLIALPSDAMLWTNIAKATRDDWSVGDTVVLASQNGMYVVIDLLDVGEVLPVGGAGSGGTLDELTDVAIASVATGDLLMKGLTGWVNGKLTASNVHADNVDGAAGTASLRTLGTGAAQAAAGNHTHASLPSTQEKDALAGTTGTPSSTNKYVTNDDARMTDARTPLAHTHPQSDITNLTTDLSNKQPLDGDLTAIAAIAPSNDDIIQRKAGAWVNRTMAQLATDLGLAAGYQPLDSDLTTIAALSPSNDTIMQRKAGAWVASTPATVKTDLALVKGDVGLGNVDNTSDANKPVSTATQTALNLKANLANPTFTGTVIVPNVAIGAGTNAATIGAVNTALGAYLTTAAAAAAYQPLDSDLTTIAGLTATTDSFMQAKAGAWSARTIAQVITDLAAGGLLTSAAAAAAYQPLDSDLTAIAGISPTNDDIIQRKAGAWINRTMAQLKTDLVLVKGDVGLGNVDNTSDLNKPISTATQTALNLKADDSLAAHLAGTETFTGAKTFSSDITMSGSGTLFLNTNNIFRLAGRLYLRDDEYSSTTTISTIGQHKLYTGTGGHTLTLPTLSGSTYGTIFVHNMGTGIVTIARASTNTINLSGSGAVTSFDLAPGESAMVMHRSSGTTQWVAAYLGGAKPSNNQPLDSDLTAIAGIAPSNDDIIQRKSGAWVNRTPAQLKTDLVLVKGDVGLGNVDNTSDLNKPVSTATQTALNLKSDTSHSHTLDSLSDVDTTGVGSGYVLSHNGTSWVVAAPGAPGAHASTHVRGATDEIDADILDIDWNPTNSTPTIVAETSHADHLSSHLKGIDDALAAKQSLDSNLTTIAAIAPTNDNFMQVKSGDWVQRTPAQAKTDLALVKGDVGLGNVDNTSDANKPVSIATQAAIDPLVPVGVIRDFGGITLPSKHLWADGSYVSRATYALLFAAYTTNKGAATVTLGTPGVFTNVAHGLAVGDAVFLTTTGALPTGMSANTTYYVMTVPTADTFTLGTTRTINASTNVTSVTTAVDTSVSQSGVHTLYHAPYGVPAGDASNFYLPDARGRVLVGLDNMNNTVGTGGGDAGRLTVANNIGAAAGEELHTTTVAELPGHTHDAGTYVIPAHSHGNGTLAIPAHSHDAGSYNIPAHSHTFAHTHGTPATNTGTGTNGLANTSVGGAGTRNADPHTHQLPAMTTNSQSTSTTSTAVSASAITGVSGTTPSATAITGTMGTTPSATAISGSSGSTLTSGGAAATAHNTMSPYLLVNKIIYTGV